MINYLLSNPLHLSSIILNIMIPINIYRKNYELIISEIPVGITSILLHHNLVDNISTLDRICARIALLHHAYFAYKNNNKFSFLLYIIFVPITYLCSKLYESSEDICKSDNYNSYMHYVLCVATYFNNKSKIEEEEILK